MPSQGRREVQQGGWALAKPTPCSIGCYRTLSGAGAKLPHRAGECWSEDSDSAGQLMHGRLGRKWVRDGEVIQQKDFAYLLH